MLCLSCGQSIGEWMRVVVPLMTRLVLSSSRVLLWYTGPDPAYIKTLSRKLDDEEVGVRGCLLPGSPVKCVWALRAQSIDAWETIGWSISRSIILIRIFSCSERWIQNVGCTPMMHISVSTTSKRLDWGHARSLESLPCSRNQFNKIWALRHDTLRCQM